MTTSKKLITADDLLALPDDGKRYELVRGELAEMPPAGDNHGFVGFKLVLRIGAFVEQHNLGHGRLAETGFLIRRPGEPDSVFAPDFAFVSFERMATPPNSRGFAEVAPDLVVEVVSPNDRQPEIDATTQMWLDASVRLVLVVYPDIQQVVTHHVDGSVRRFATGDTLTAEPVLPGFECPVADIFTY